MIAPDRIMILSIIRKISKHQEKIGYSNFSHFTNSNVSNFTRDEFMWMKNNKKIYNDIKKKFLTYIGSHRSRNHDLEKMLCRLGLSDRLIR